MRHGEAHIRARRRSRRLCDGGADPPGRNGAALERQELGIDMPLLMKVPILGEGQDPAAIVSFEMEQMIMPRIKGLHVPQFVAAGDCAVHPYIVMERLPGKALLQRLPDLPLPYEEVAQIGWKIATALADIHRQHVIHLDLKPSNVLFRPHGRGRLIDYGLSHHLQLPDLHAGGVPPSLRHRALHGAGAAFRRPARPAHRSICAWRSSLFLIPPGSGPSARERTLGRDEKAALEDRSRRAVCERTIRFGCRKSYCAASK